MTHSSHQFNNYNPCPSSKKITTTNGSLTIFVGVDVQSSPTLTLRNVFHVPRLSTNLISIQKFIWDLGCNVVFYPTYCVFQDQDLGKMIGLAKERNMLYYLEIPSELSVSFLFEHHFFNKRKIRLHHHRLGHLSFITLKILFPSLFEKLDIESFHCEACELAIHKHSTFSISDKRSSKPLYLIHSDIWGPSPIPNICGAR